MDLMPDNSPELDIDETPSAKPVPLRIQLTIIPTSGQFVQLTDLAYVFEALDSLNNSEGFDARILPGAY